MRPILIALPLALTLPMAAQSPMFRGNPSHTGVYDAPSKPVQGKIAWSFESLNWDLYQTLEDADGGFIWPTTPAVVKGRIYFCAGPFFFAVDETGKEAYRVRLGGRSLASPAVVGDLAYVPTDEGVLLALDIRDGRVRWSSIVGHKTFLGQVDDWDVYHSSPTVADGTVYVGGADGRIYAVSATDGKERWHFQTNHVVRATPAVADGRVFCGSFDGKVYALDAATGKELWEVNTKTPGVPWNSVQGSCAVMDGLVYVGSRSCFSYAIDAATGVVCWRHSHEGNWVPSSPAVRDGIVYVGQSDGSKVTALGAKGESLWVFNAPNETFASPALAGDVLFVAGNDNYNMKGKGSLSAVDIKTGKALWTLEFPGSVWASPVIAGDTIYVSCADGKLYAVR
jgi:eukaryotic-like serine/threonine-protein kinase